MRPRPHAAPVLAAPERERAGCRMRAWAIAALMAALLLLLGPWPAHADPPPPVRCAPAGGAWSLTSNLPGRVVAMEAARDGEHVVLALTVLNGRRRRVFVAEVGAEGQWAVAPREVTAVRVPRGGVVALAAAGGQRQLVLTAHGRVQTVLLGADATSDRVVELAAPARRAGAALVAADASGFVLVWPRPGRAWVQRVALGEDHASAAVEARLPERTMAVSVAAGAEGAVGLVVRSPGRRYFVAVAGSDGRVRWPGNGPAGCDARGRCAPVRLWSAPGGGFVAGWAEHPTDDGLAVFGARAIDATGHARGRASEFIPVVRGNIVAGPQGQGMLVQLGRPLVLRGGERPVAVPEVAPQEDTPRGDRGHGHGRVDVNEFPVAARAWPTSGDEPGFEVLGVSGVGLVTRGLLRCGGD